MTGALHALGLLHHGSTDLTGGACRRRRTALEALFAEPSPAAPLTLCPPATDAAIAAQ
ncbi:MULTISPECIES: hypothetical protein [Streptomyces]|uniref:hypothetical protein n=1 Tax=Streptomyces TaxID=1883 RepID=UPI00200D3A96|nr:hypothetical protein [Streptomyces sp. LRE541]UPZ33777.1 hypothetical protein MUK60_41850 [Streptomyces sp. LRE541]